VSIYINKIIELNKYFCLYHDVMSLIEGRFFIAKICKICVYWYVV